MRNEMKFADWPGSCGSVNKSKGFVETLEFRSREGSRAPAITAWQKKPQLLQLGCPKPNHQTMGKDRKGRPTKTALFPPFPRRGRPTSTFNANRASLVSMPMDQDRAGRERERMSPSRAAAGNE